MAASLVHTPEMSGSPHGVFAAATVLAGAEGFAGACAYTAANDPLTNAVESITTNAEDFWCMCPSVRLSRTLRIHSIIACHTAFSKSRCSGPLAPCIMIMDTIFSFGSMFWLVP